MSLLTKVSFLKIWHHMPIKKHNLEFHLASYESLRSYQGNTWYMSSGFYWDYFEGYFTKVCRLHSLKEPSNSDAWLPDLFANDSKAKTDKTEKRSILIYTIIIEDFNTHPSEFDRINSNKISKDIENLNTWSKYHMLKFLLLIAQNITMFEDKVFKVHTGSFSLKMKSSRGA